MKRQTLRNLVHFCSQKPEFVLEEMCWLGIRHLSLAEPMIDTFQIPFFSVSAFFVFDMFPLEEFIKVQFFLQLLILSFISRQRRESKEFSRIVVPSSYLSHIKPSSSSPWVFVLNRVFLDSNFDFNKKACLSFLGVKVLLFVGDLLFNGFVKILVPSLSSVYCRRAWGFTCA